MKLGCNIYLILLSILFQCSLYLIMLILLLFLKIIGPLEDGEMFNQDDFHLLENIILKTSGQKIKSQIQQLGFEEDL